jgi:D-psicose/D-tagatose/L-ribulose 3-epimerase
VKIGISAFAWTARFTDIHLKLLPEIKSMGFSALEVPMFNPEALATERIRDAFAENDLACTVCAILPKPYNPISPNQKIRSESTDHLIRCVRASAAMGSKIIGGPLFAPIGYLPKHRPTEGEWSWAVEAFRRLEDVLESNDMTLSIEPVNRSETFFLRTAQEAKLLCERIGNRRIGVTVDTFHANIEESSIPAAIRSLGKHLMHVHASENDRGRLGFGHIPFGEIIQTLRQIGYDGYLIIEGFGHNPREKNSPGYLWANVDVTPERLALEGMKYLSGVHQYSVMPSA